MASLILIAYNFSIMVLGEFFTIRLIANLRLFWDQMQDEAFKARCEAEYNAIKQHWSAYQRDRDDEGS